MNPPVVRCISECFVKPHSVSEESKHPYYLTPWDLAMISVEYVQKGLLFAKPRDKDQEDLMKNILERLKQSLSLALVHFYPLTGRLVTKKEENQNPPCYYVFVDCNNSPGAKLVHATAVDMTVSDVVFPTYVPLVVRYFFDLDGAINHGSNPLLSIQVTELVDGVFIGCSMNHAIVDGTSFGHFFNALSEIFQGDENNVRKISRLPMLKKWFPNGHVPLISLPFTHQDDQSITKSEAPQLLERIFHFSEESIAKIEAKANWESNTTKISSFQSLSAFLWRSITKARGFHSDRITNCKLAIDNRSRLEPTLSKDFFGNLYQTVKAVATAGELLEHNLGWAAWKLHQAEVNHTDKSVHEFVNDWVRSHFVYQLGQLFNSSSVMIGNSPRFNNYGNEFGLGKALTLRSGSGNKLDGKVTLYQGRESEGSMDLEVCLPAHSMHDLESDEEFMSFVSSSIA
ncbi:Transferase [Corchorus capsularis]|uniref:Transferase n=1 Tax=Corchorus capsularis TaxID=210143 RepID=A0A1R3IJ64_COCAP|nr:Transferase [Corchorus capsularis]